MLSWCVQVRLQGLYQYPTTSTPQKTPFKLSVCAMGCPDLYSAYPRLHTAIGTKWKRKQKYLPFYSCIVYRACFGWLRSENAIKCFFFHIIHSIDYSCVVNYLIICFSWKNYFIFISFITRFTGFMGWIFYSNFYFVFVCVSRKFNMFALNCFCIWTRWCTYT